MFLNLHLCIIKMRVPGKVITVALLSEELRLGVDQELPALHSGFSLMPSCARTLGKGSKTGEIWGWAQRGEGI